MNKPNTPFKGKFKLYGSKKKKIVQDLNLLKIINDYQYYYNNNYTLTKLLLR